MKKVVRWLFGTATARVGGDTARFINVAVKSGIRPVALKKDGTNVLFTVRASEYKKLHAVKLRTRASVKLTEKSGLPFRFRRMRRRPGLLLGTALSAALILYLSGFYWEIVPSGENIPYAESEILSATKRVGIYIGAPKSTDTALASISLLKELPALSWASFNTDGCTVQLEMRTPDEKAEGAEQDGTADIIAARAGLIRSVTAQSGTVLVKVGSACAAGQVLVSGVTQIGDPYDPENNPVRYLYSRARAEIMAETRRTFTASCPLSEEITEETDLGVRRALCVLGVRVPLSFAGAPEGKTVFTREPLTLFGHTLPVWTESMRVYREERKTVTFTEDEAKRRALENLRRLQKNALGSNGKLLSETLTYRVKNNTVYVSSVSVCLEDIAKEAPITLPKEAENPESEGVFVGNVQGNG